MLKKAGTMICTMAKPAASASIITTIVSNRNCDTICHLAAPTTFLISTSFNLLAVQLTYYNTPHN